MSHLTERIAEFAFEELSPFEMSAARRHIEECSQCRHQVEQFQRTHAMLKASPDIDPPRHIVFAPPERRSWLSLLDWRLAMPVSAAAALVIAILIALSPAPAPIIISAQTPAPVVVQTQSVDYNQIVNDLRQSERVWLAAELEKRDKQIQRLQGELAYYENYQRVVMKETLENASSIQLLAERR